MPFDALTLANMDVKVLIAVGDGDKLRLANFLTMLAPVWEKVTGRTAWQTKDSDKLSYGNHKQCYFADWLSEVHTLMGLSKPRIRHIVDIMEGRKSYYAEEN
jgi:hypothetical protein